MTDPKQAMQQAVDALTGAARFIKNGVEFGYIRMPDADCPDPAHETPGKVDAAITALRAALSSIPDVKAVPVAWMTEDGERVVTERTMRQNDIGAGATAMRAYTVPLYYASSAQKEPGETGMDERKTDGVTACPPVGQDVAFNEAERLVLDLRNAVWQAQSLAETREAEDALMQFLRRAFGVSVAGHQTFPRHTLGDSPGSEKE
jgi:hypothetical protein